MDNLRRIKARLRGACAGHQLQSRRLAGRVAEHGSLRVRPHHTNRSSQTALALIGVLLTLLTACSKRDKVVGIGDDDPEMAAAIAKARQTLPQFWQVFDQREHGESNFVLVVRITDKGRVEHFFTSDFERRDGKTMVTISNAPKIVASVKLGDRIEIPEADITDWRYMRDGKYVGNMTFKVQLKHMNMPAADVERIKQMMADP